MTPYSGNIGAMTPMTSYIRLNPIFLPLLIEEPPVRVRARASRYYNAQPIPSEEVIETYEERIRALPGQKWQ
jgi:hypothetical protein